MHYTTSLYRFVSGIIVAIIVLLGGVFVGIWGETTSVGAVDYDQALTTPPFEDIFTNNPTGEDAVDIGVLTDQFAVRDDEGFVAQIIDLFFDADLNNEEQKATYYIKWVINLALSFIGLIALVVLILGFYKMFTAGNREEGRAEAKTTVIRAAMALAVIALAWFVVSWFFDIFVTVVEPLTG